MSFLNAYIVKTASEDVRDMKICDKDKGMETIFGVTHAVTIIHSFCPCSHIDDQISFKSVYEMFLK